jgi:hypothetical protein
LVSDIPAGDGKLVNLFLRCTDKKMGCEFFSCVRKSGRRSDATR